ncbi:MAG TPA: glycosyltransferase [Solirubrobacterales bacterium]
MNRPPVSVVIPFGGDAPAAHRLLASLSRLELSDSDELIVADNSADGSAWKALGDGAGPLEAMDAGPRVVPATAERSSYHARNAGAVSARSEWLLFMDADCAPSPDILRAYFAQPIADRCGAVAGQILGDPKQRSLAARYARSRRLFDHSKGLIRAEAGTAAAGNLLVREAAFRELGGFVEGIRSGGDLDLCRRLHLAGWELGYRPDAVVHHRHREGLASLLGAIVRYGAGARWLNERYPGTSPRWPLGLGLRGAARDVWAAAVRRRWRSALYRVIDGLGLIAHNIGYVKGNAAKSR